MSDLVNNLRIAARYDHSQGAMMVKAADTIEQLQQRNAVLESLNSFNLSMISKLGSRIRDAYEAGVQDTIEEVHCPAPFNVSRRSENYLASLIKRLSVETKELTK